LALDVKREYYDMGLPFIEKAGVAHKIDFREGPALPFLDELLKDVRASLMCQQLKFHPCFEYWLG